MLAHAFLATTTTAADNRHDQPDNPTLIPITVNETRRLALAIIGLPAATLDHVLHWSHYRRRNHQPN